MTNTRIRRTFTACFAAALLMGVVACSSSDKPEAKADETTTSTAQAPTTDRDASTASTTGAGDASGAPDAVPKELADLSEAESACVQRFLGTANTTDYADSANTDQLQSILDEPDCDAAFSTLTAGDYTNAQWFQALSPEAQEWFKNNQ